MVVRRVITNLTPEALRFRRESCEKKRWFLTRIDAELVGSKWKQRAYHCRFCDGYHLTAKELTLEQKMEETTNRLLRGV